MPLFSRRADPPKPNDELAVLQHSIQNRGQAKIAEADAYVSQYLDGVAAHAGVLNDPEAMAWLRDRIRYFMVIGWAGWFKILDRLPEGPVLAAEWAQLARDPARFGPGHLVAWWWLLQESLYRPSVANQFEEMRGALTDGVAAIARSGGNYRQDMINWQEFFDSF